MITGGPGTGKTYSILRLVAALLLQHPGLRVRLAAPTGKAAVRMTEATGNDLLGADAAPALRERYREVNQRLKALPPTPSTGSSRSTPTPAHRATTVRRPSPPI